MCTNFYYSSRLYYFSWSALDTSGNSWTDTELNYVVDTIPPNIPTLSVDTESPFDIDNPELTFSSLDNVWVDFYTVTYSGDDGWTGTGTLTTINPAISPVILNLDPDEWLRLHLLNFHL